MTGNSIRDLLLPTFPYTYVTVAPSKISPVLVVKELDNEVITTKDAVVGANELQQIFVYAKESSTAQDILKLLILECKTTFFNEGVTLQSVAPIEFDSEQGVYMASITVSSFTYY